MDACNTSSCSPNVFFKSFTACTSFWTDSDCDLRLSSSCCKLFRSFCSERNSVLPWSSKPLTSCNSPCGSGKLSPVSAEVFTAFDILVVAEFASDARTSAASATVFASVASTEAVVAVRRSSASSLRAINNSSRIIPISASRPGNFPSFISKNSSSNVTMRTSLRDDTSSINFSTCCACSAAMSCLRDLNRASASAIAYMASAAIWSWSEVSSAAAKPSTSEPLVFQAISLGASLSSADWSEATST
mmetsp:Transcript_14426/g.39425  ORF Transcript_14426/g.39425 Transcript_14426/m.39425 type:complete len:246 (+) Transcript_14426:1030-1767(+)